MNDKQKEQLAKLKNDNKDCYIDNTDAIRKDKKSQAIKQDLNTFLRHKYQNKTLNIDFLQNNCSFLYLNYPEIFNKITTDLNFDFKLLYQFIDILQKIENGVVNQDEASFEIGNLLKQIYIDPVIHDKKLSKKNISWNEYKLNICN